MKMSTRRVKNAIRRGRFNRQVGIFFPNILSRVGRLMTEVWRYHRKEFTAEKVQFPDGLL
jgi:hypothetical protein